MEDILKDLEELDKQIGEAKRTLAVFEGNKQSLLKRLKEEFNLHTISEVTKELAKLEKENIALTNTIQEKYNDLRASYEW